MPATRVRLDHIVSPQYVAIREVFEDKDVYIVPQGEQRPPCRMEIYTGWVSIKYEIDKPSWNLRQEFRSFVPWERNGLAEYGARSDIVSTAASASLSAFSANSDPSLCGVEQAFVAFEQVAFKDENGILITPLVMVLRTWLGAHQAGIYSFSYHVTVLSKLPVLSPGPPPTPPPGTTLPPKFRLRSDVPGNLMPR